LIIYKKYWVTHAVCTTYANTNGMLYFIFCRPRYHERYLYTFFSMLYPETTEILNFSMPDGLSAEGLQRR
jgi:hypothetical protein